MSEMAEVQTPHNNLGQTPVKKKKKKKNHNNNAQRSQKAKNNYCMLCRKIHLKDEAQEHVHGMLHHRELETVLGKDSFHECQACTASSMGLNEYAQHISTAQHKANLKSLMFKKTKPHPLYKTLSKETMSQILERNKTLKKEEKKKKKKKQKQVDGQKRAEMLQGASRINTVVSKVVKADKSKQVNNWTLQQGTYQQGRNNAVVQNKENKVSSLQRPLHQGELTLQTQSGRLTCLSGEPAGQTLHYPSVCHQCTQSAQQMRYDGNFETTTINEIESSQTDQQNDYYNKAYDGDFTSDHLPDNGAIIFGHGQNESAESSPSGQEVSPQHAPANETANTAPIRDVDVSAMLRQIRRALGVREPCRADREARKQNTEAGVQVADGTTQQAGAETGQRADGSGKEATLHTTSAAATSSQVNSPDPASHSDVCPSSIAPPKPQQATFKMTQGTTQQCETSSMFESDSNGPAVTRKVQIASESAKIQGGKEAGPNPNHNKLFSFSVATSKPREMYKGKKRKKQKKGKGMPRFGIELANPLFYQESATQAEGNDMSLSEGFQWESFPGSLSGAHWMGLPPLPQDSTYYDLYTEMQSDSQMQEPLEQPGAAQEGCSSQTVDGVSVKMDSSLLAGNARKRKQNVEPSGKKKKTKSNKDQGQMDQLLAVSLREDELSHSLQDLDKSLFQVRNTLQAAYTEVQRLLLLRQQFTAEVNSLRAQRIEILQGMKGVYTGSSDVAEKATTLSAGAAATVQPRLSPLPSSSAFPTSSSQQLSPTIPASSISPIALPTIPVKQGIFHPPTAEQASQFDSCNSDTLQAPANQPLPLFPSDLLPSPHLASPTTAVTSLTQLKTECSTSANTNHFPQSSAQQQTVSLVRGEVQLADGDSEEETGGSLCIEPVKEKEPTAEKPVSTSVPKEDQNASDSTPDENGGKVSGASLELMKLSDLVVIDSEESNKEDAQNVPVHQQPPQKCVSVELSSLSTQESQQHPLEVAVINDDERKVQPMPNAASVPSECIDVVENEEPSVGAFLDHAGPIHSLHVHEGRLYTCSGDNTARAYSLVTREYQAVFEGHTNKVNCLLVSSLPNMPARLFTGSSDKTIRCYSIKTTKCLEEITLSDRVLCLHMAWNILYAGLSNGSVASYDLKTLKQLDLFECHGPRGVSCLATAQEGARRVLLVGSYDSTISVRDAKSSLLLRSLEGHTKTVLCMKVVNDLVFSGSSDTSVHAHNIHTGELVRIYKGHNHAVTSIVILGKVMVTACLDKLVRVYELQSDDSLQVYGGHSDMVLCMAVHKSVIYTGCYDGTVQAVKLNLLKNYRCWWQNCTLIFGKAEHLSQHLVGDHSNPNLQAVKCRWRGCSTFFDRQQSVKENLPEHMQSHVENDSEVQP